VAARSDDLTPEQLELVLAAILARTRSATAGAVLALGAVIDEMLAAPGATPDAVVSTLIAARDTTPHFGKFTSSVRAATSAAVDNVGDDVQEDVYRGAGLGKAWTWIGVLDAGSRCPIGIELPDGRGGGCKQRHGQAFTDAEYVILGKPRSGGGTICGNNCRCVRVPAESTHTQKQVEVLGQGSVRFHGEGLRPDLVDPITRARRVRRGA